MPNSPSYYGEQAARAQAGALANFQALQNQYYQNQADSALPAILMSLGQQQEAPQAPMPGQPSASQTPPQAPPMGVTAPMSPVSTQQMPPMPGAGAPSNYNAGTANSSGLNPLANNNTGGGQGTPAPQGGPNISRVPQQQPQQAPQQLSPGTQGGYDIASFLAAVKQANPNISGGALRNILTTVNPLLFKPQEQLQLAQLKALTSRQNNMDTNDTRVQTTQMRDDTSTSNTDKRIAAQQGAASLDPEDAQYLAKQYAQFGAATLTRLPAGTRMAVIKAARENGTTPEEIAQNIAANAGIRSEAVNTGKLSSNIGYATKEIGQLAPRIDELAKKIGQGGLKPFNTVGNLLKTQTSNPDLIALKSDITDFINAQVRQSTGKSPTKAETTAFADTIDINMGAKGISAAVAEAVNQGKFSSTALGKQTGGGNSGASNDPLGIR